MKHRGYMSVFFSLSIVSICALLFAMAESARVAGARCYLQMAVNSSIDSVFSQYHRELWEQYRLLFVEYQSESEAAADFKQFLAPYLEADSWYPMADQETVVGQMLRATDSGGDYFKQEILDYMKFGVWNMQFQPEQMGTLYQDGREAAAVHEVAGSYRGSTKAAWKLEQAIEQINGNLEEQGQILANAHACLRNYDGHGFERSADRLIQQLGRIPALVNTYVKRAEQLAGSLEESRAKLDTEYEKLSDGVRTGLEQEIAEYQSYIAKDGERRQEIENLCAWSEAQIERVRAAIQEADEVMEILSEWEDDEDEEGDGPDEAQLWGRVIAKLNQFQPQSLHVNHGIKDQEKQNWLEQAESLFRLDILSLVLPQGTQVSKNVLDMKELPSLHVKGNSMGKVQGSGGESSRESGRGSSGESGRESSGESGGLAERLLVTVYSGQFFSDFCKVKGTAADATAAALAAVTKSPIADASANAAKVTPTAKHQERPMQYEMEYLFAGEAIEERNLELTARQLLLIREGLNLIHIFSNSAKRQEAKALATVIVGATGLVPLVMVTAFFIMSVWALGEAIMDLRLLLNGKKVPLLKSSVDWQLSLQQLLSIGRDGGVPQTEGTGRGLDYQAYLQFILFFLEPQTLYYRMMDVIQINLCRKQASFRMGHAIYRLEIRETVMNKHVFLAPALFRAYGNAPGLRYESQAVTQKAY